MGAAASLSFKLTLLVKGLLHWSPLTILARSPAETMVLFSLNSPLGHLGEDQGRGLRAERAIREEEEEMWAFKGQPEYD